MQTNKDNVAHPSDIGSGDSGGGWRGNRWRLAIWGAAALLLMLPLAAMQFTDEVDWNETDFIVIGAMLFAACGTYELATRMSDNTVYRAACGVAVVTAFVLVWVNLAVGIIGSENNPANLMVFGVLAVGLIGAFIARFQPRGMACALVAMAVAQVLVAVIVVVTGWGMPHGATVEVIGITAFFVVPWLVSAALFWNAAQTHAHRVED